VNVPVVDGEAVREFLDKAEPFCSASYLADLAGALERRTAAARGGTMDWPLRWQLAPVARRVNQEERAVWQDRLQPVWDAAVAGDGDHVMGLLAGWSDRPRWLVDWATYWLHVMHPEWLWWARWVLEPAQRTGALLLVSGDPGGLWEAGLGEVYHVLAETSRFLGSVLDHTHRLTGIPERFRPMVALAMVYAVYMFTLSAWKLTEEFTRVFPPLPRVVRILLGVNRWEATSVGG
jgi:hypothetical protein